MRKQRIITLFEHQSRTYQDAGLDLDSPIIELIDQLNDRLGKNFLILGRKSIKATEYVGVMRVGDITIQVDDYNSVLYSAMKTARVAIVFCVP